MAIPSILVGFVRAGFGFYVVVVFRLLCAKGGGRCFCDDTVDRGQVLRKRRMKRFRCRLIKYERKKKPDSKSITKKDPEITGVEEEREKKKKSLESL